MTNSQEPERLPAPTLFGSHCGCGLSDGLLARAQRGWDAFLARTGPLPGEGEGEESRR
ncbi:hypothetical protein [Streptomyces sp. NPDC051909]|uniref:hypothetical protein n=1 Tax=Streptomyces sp. NPDC051909 TaxID=3154944 RepID=UPI00341CDC9A